MELQNVGVIVTGGASGLGGATASRLAAQGAKVAIFDLNGGVGQAHAAEIGGVFVRVNVADETSVADGIAAAEAAHGIARVLVNCAGIAPAAKTIGKDGQPHAVDTFRKAIEVNLIGTFIMLARFAARLATVDPVGEERGVIINTASVAAYEGQIGQTAYGASKAGVVGLTLPAARDLAPLGIRVITIAPGIFWTPMLAALPPAAQESLGKQVPFPSRLGRPDEYADLVSAIIANQMLNGETIRLDGAIRMGPR